MADVLAERNKKLRSSPLQDEHEEDELDEETQYLDSMSRERIKQILADFQEDMKNYDHKKEGEAVSYSPLFPERLAFLQ